MKGKNEREHKYRICITKYILTEENLDTNEKVIAYCIENGILNGEEYIIEIKEEWVNDFDTMW